MIVEEFKKGDDLFRRRYIRFTSDMLLKWVNIRNLDKLQSQNNLRSIEVMKLSEIDLRTRLSHLKILMLKGIIKIFESK